MPRLDEVRLKSTHNSYSGGTRGGLLRQLDVGVRCLEFDLHDNGFADIGDFRIGHLTPGAEIALGNGAPGDNPNTHLFRPWLDVLAGWSSTHMGHGPMVIVIDVKDDLTDNAGEGDLTDLNQALIDTIGARLFTRDDFDSTGQWPDVTDLTDRVVCVLSGHGANRESYRWARGTTPAIAVNDAGQVVLAYRTTTNDLVCWAGLVDESAARVVWQRRQPLAAGIRLREPAVTLTEDGWIVAAHVFEDPNVPNVPRIASRLGRLQDDGKVNWHGGDVVAVGSSPTLSLDGDNVREIHRRHDAVGRQIRTGVLNRSRRRIEWKQPRATPAVPAPIDDAIWRGRRISARVTNDGVVVCGFDDAPLPPVRLPQSLFVEMQHETERVRLVDPLFFGADAKNVAALGQARLGGLIARAWNFERIDTTNPPSPRENMPATNEIDDPLQWYADYMTGSDVVA